MIELHSGEEVKMVVRKHWFVFIGQAIFVLFLIVLPFIVWFLLNLLGNYSDADLLANIPVVFFTILWLFFVWIWAFILWTDYYLDVWMVTNKRIISIDQKGFFRREISTFRMERVQDITTEIGGFIPTLFNFGDITVQTAGDDKNFVMRGAPAPNSIKEVISAMLEARHNSLDQQDEGL